MEKNTNKTNKIGITERGDAGIDFGWLPKLKQNIVDGAVLITKQLNPTFNAHVMDLYNSGFTQIVVHCTCTGWGGSIIEPNVPVYTKQLEQLQQLIDSGFPKEQCVLRIDPIFPTKNGIKRVTEVLDTAFDMELLPDMRIRISILDEYKHVKERFRALGYDAIYGDSFYAPKHMVQDLVEALDRYDLQFECCAEPYLVNENQFAHTGCISERDLRVFGLSCDNTAVNPQNRGGCLCLACKTELLDCKRRCKHQCAYCYWKN